MTNPEIPDDRDRAPHGDVDPADVDSTDGVALLVRHTLAAVADATEVEPRPLDRSSAAISVLERPADAGAPASPRPTPPIAPAAERDLGDGAVAVVPIGVEPARARRAGGRWLAGVAAAALVLLVIGLVTVVADDGTVSTGPGNPDPSPTAAAPAPFDDATFISPPRTVGDVELADIRVAGWRADGAGVTGNAAITVSSDPVLPPFTSTAESGLIINFSFASTSGDGGEEPAHVFVRTGVTLDPIGADMPGTDPVPAVDGLRVAHLEGCVPPRTSSDPVQSVPATHPEDRPPTLAEPLPSPSCRVAVTAWAGDHVISIDAIDAAVVDDVLQGLRRETLVELEARLAGVAHVGDIRRALESLAGPVTPDPTTLPGSPGVTAPPSTTDPLVEGTVVDPAPTTSPPVAEPSACTTWGGVETHLRQTGDVFDAGSGEDLLGFQGFAPPDLQADVARLIEIAMVSPPTAEQAEILVRIRARIEGLCGALEALPGH
jgi:hypothetical protein